MTTPNPATTDWVPLWPLGGTPVAAAIASIPGEIKMWPGQTLPNLAKYGKWVWADGAIYAVATYPEAAANIDPAWKTAHGLADPGAGNFRAPDLRGVLPAGMDAMPGGSRVNRITRAVAITICGRTGEETHVVSVGEMPAHGHTVNSHQHGGGDHRHNLRFTRGSGTYSGAVADNNYNYGDYYSADANQTSGVIIAAEAPGTNNIGGGAAHENLPPTIFVPWIVRLDG